MGFPWGFCGGSGLLLASGWPLAAGSGSGPPAGSGNPRDTAHPVFPCSETIMFLHQIFYQGLKARISSWPTLVLGE